MKRLPFLRLFGKSDRVETRAIDPATGVPQATEIPMPPVQPPKEAYLLGWEVIGRGRIGKLSGDSPFYVRAQRVSDKKVVTGEGANEEEARKNLMKRINDSEPKPAPPVVPIPGWEVSPPHWHPYEADGNCMGGPSGAYWQIWAKSLKDGKHTSGCGETVEEAYAQLLHRTRDKDNEIDIAAREYASLIGDPNWEDYREKIREALAMHQALDKIGRFYPDR